MNNSEIKGTSPTLLKAIQELDYRLKDKVQPFTLKVVGGGAMLLSGVSQNRNQFTDLDYIGEDIYTIFDDKIVRIIEEVGVKYHLGKKWINNDLLLPEHNLEDIEYSTGVLHFKELDKLNVITICVLEPVDIIRMKVIAIDTQLSTLENTKEFTRVKDWQDIRELSKYTGSNYKDIIEDAEPYIYEQFTKKVIRYIIENEDDNIIKEFINSNYSEVNFF